MSRNPALWSAILFLSGIGASISGLQNPVFASILLTVSGALGIWAVIDWTKLPPFFRRTFESINALSFGGKLPLPEAATIAYEEARASESIWADAAERLAVNKTPAGILDYFACYFAREVPLYGKRPPSRKLELIGDVQARQGTFSGGAKTLHLRDQGHTTFVDLMVSKKDLTRMVDAVKQGLKTTSAI